jgi:transposase InsO family protein
VAEFTADLRHIAGTANVVADTLSRPPQRPPTSSPGSRMASGPQGEWINAVASPSPSPSVDFALIAANQAGCASVAQARQSSCLEVSQVLIEGTPLWCDTSAGRLRPIIPVADRRRIFDVIHQLAHPGTKATIRLISARFVWCGMAKQITAWCRDCVNCHTSKASLQPPSPVQSIPVPAARFTHIHVDLVGPLPTSAEGHTHLLTMVDRSTRWLEAIPLRGTTAAAVADSLIAGWISRFGVPSTITSDRGAQFTSALWSALCSRLGINHRLTTAYHPQSNGMIERCHRRLKEALKAKAAGVSWLDHLPWVLLGMRSSPRDDTAVSAAEMVYGCQLTVPGQFNPSTPSPSPTADVPGPLPTPPQTTRTWADVVASPPSHLASADFVYVKRSAIAGPLAPSFSGPFQVLRRGAKSFDVAIGDKTETVSVDRLKAHLGSGPVRPPLPPARGRPASAPSVLHPQASAIVLGGAPVAEPI